MNNKDPYPADPATKSPAQRESGFTAIVAEGGGQRGIFTAGVLDAFQQQQFNPFQLAIGSSAGAQNLLSYWLGQQGYARRMIQELTTKPDFYVPYRWLMAKSVVDLDSYFNHAQTNPDYQLPLSLFDPLTSAKPIEFVATNKKTGDAVYLQPTSATVIDCLKASSAVPFLYRNSVHIDGQELFDGGVADPVPVVRAHNLGADRIVVIRTVPARSKDSMWRVRLEQALKKQKLHPKLARMLNAHEASYQRAGSFICSPPTGVSILEITPPEPLSSQTFGSSSDALIKDYVSGFKQGSVAITRIEKWLLDRSHFYRQSIPEASPL